MSLYNRLDPKADLNDPRVRAQLNETLDLLSSRLTRGERGERGPQGPPGPPGENAGNSLDTDWALDSTAGANWTTNTTTRVWTRRRGKSLDARWELKFTGAPDTGTLLLNLPSGRNVDTSLLPDVENVVVGHGGMVDSGTAYKGPLEVNVTGTTQLRAYYPAFATNNMEELTRTAPVTIANGDSINFTVLGLPIAEWA